MARRRFLSILAAIGGVVATGACGLLRNDAEVRYRVTMTIDDNGTERSGSSVWSWKLREPTVALTSSYDGEFRGEAVAVDLSGGRTLYATLRGVDGGSDVAPLMPERLLGDTGRVARGEPRRFAPDRVADLRDIALSVGELATLDCEEHPDWCPMLVTFADESDPTSVQQVRPGNLAVVFGSNVLFKSLTATVVDHPVTSGINGGLAWLSHFPEPRLDPLYRGSTNPNLPQLLSHGDFQANAIR